MPKEIQKSGQTFGELNKSDLGGPLLVGDSSHVQITTMKFDGTNYLICSKSVLIYIQGKDKEVGVGVGMGRAMVGLGPSL